MTQVATRAVARPFQNSLEHVLAGLTYVDLRVRWAVVRARIHGLDPDDEFRGLYVTENQIDNLLGYDLGHNLWSSLNGVELNGMQNDLEQWPKSLATARRDWEERTLASRKAGIPLRLDQLIRNFQLTSHEADSLLLALAPEVDLRYEKLFAFLQDDVTKKRPSINLILNLLSDSFAEKLRLRHLFSDSGRLIRHSLLVRFSEGPASEPPLLSHYVRPATRVIEHLLDFLGIDNRLASSTEVLDDSQVHPSSRLPAGLLTQLVNATPENPIFSFIGIYGVGKREGAIHLAHTTKKKLVTLNLLALADSEIGIIEGLRVTLRDSLLLDAIVYITGWDSLIKDNRPPLNIMNMLFDYPGIVILAGNTDWQPANRRNNRPVFTVNLQPANYNTRLRVWQHNLPKTSLDLSPIANHFRFTPGQIEDAIATARDSARWRGEQLTYQDLLSASRTHSNQKLSSLATKIRPRYTWDDIVLPSDTLAQLHEVVNTVDHRPTVYGQWGFGKKLALGKGLNALFAGESGTGKTMSADIIAGQLGLDLYKIDLSSLVSKYIGETEKNLDKIFTEASTSNSILFFDEADAIFGKRSEVKDSHDRYANIETGYLLQRMEEYDGVVILATNLRANIDEAFTRRLHFAIEFPFPEPIDRARIWRVTFPKETPRLDDIDYNILGERFRIAGGSIRNVVLASAFLAARDQAGAVGMKHLFHAVRREYQKMGRLINEKLFTLSDEEELYY